jgi:hypothetical protein
MMLCLGPALLLVFAASQGRACVSLNHDWRILHHESRVEEFPGLGVSEFLAESYRRFQDQRRVLGQATGSPTITIGGGTIKGNALSTAATAADVHAVLPGYWSVLPASQCVGLGGAEVAMATMGLASGAFVALLDVASSSNELSFQADLNHLGMIFRLVYLEKVLGRIIVLDHQGEIAFIEEISVHPLLQTDLIFCPFGAYIRNFEKKSIFPVATDWEKIFPPAEQRLGLPVTASTSVIASASIAAPATVSTSAVASTSVIASASIAAPATVSTSAVASSSPSAPVAAP